MLRISGALVRVTLAVCALAGCAADTSDETDVAEGELRARDDARSRGCVRDDKNFGRCVSEKELAKHLREAGFPEEIIGAMVCTAAYESNRYESRVNDKNKNKTVDRGVLQVNSVHVGKTEGCPSEGEDLFDAATNIRCAYAVYKDRQGRAKDPHEGIKAWYGYAGAPGKPSTSHVKECDAYVAAE